MKQNIIRIKILIKYILNRNIRFKVNNEHGLYSKVPDDKILKKMFKIWVGYDLNLSKPITYQEKMQWLKLHDRKDLYTIMADKIKMKDFVSQKIGEKYVVPIIACWDSPKEIEVDKLPNQFVLKCNHNSGTGMYICKDKSSMRIGTIKKNLEKGMKEDYFTYAREWPYKNIERKVFAEKYLENNDGSEITEYKVLCFEGKAKLVELILNRFKGNATQDFYTPDWVKTEIYENDIPPSDNEFVRPENLSRIIELSEILAEGIHHLRVDWYEVNGKIYVGELTFFDGGGFSLFYPQKYNEIIGSWIQLESEEM